MGDDQGRARRAWQRLRGWRPDRWVLAVWALTVLPIVTATANAVRRGWLPISDNAIVAIRASDVFTSHHPWIGTYSSASASAAKELNHPGPLLFDSLWPTVQLFGSQAGVAIGVALVNILAITTTCVFAYRIGGRRTALAALAAAAALVYTMGSELLFDPWNPHILILVCLALLVTAWAIALGDRWAWPVYVALGSYSLQTHLGYAYLVPALLLVALAAGAVAARACPDAGRWLPTRRTLGISVITGVALWAQPVWEQLAGPGEGNLSRLLSGAGGGNKIGGELSVRVLSEVITGSVLGPRDGLLNAIQGLRLTDAGEVKPLDAPSVPLAIVILLTLLAAIVLLARAAMRRQDRMVLTLLGTAGGSLVLGFAMVAVMPIGPFGLAAHQMRWLWPIAWFTWMAIAVATVRWAADAMRSRDLRWSPPHVATIVAVAAVAALSLLAVPTFRQPVGPAGSAHIIPTMDALGKQLGGLEGRGVVWVDTAGEPFVDSAIETLMAELQRRDIEFVVEPEWLVRQLGEDRRRQGDEPLTVALRRDAEAFALPDGAQLEGRVTPLSPAEQDELAALLAVQAEGVAWDAPQQERLDALLAAATGSIAVVSWRT